MSLTSGSGSGEGGGVAWAGGGVTWAGGEGGGITWAVASKTKWFGVQVPVIRFEGSKKSVQSIYQTIFKYFKCLR